MSYTPVGAGGGGTWEFISTATISSDATIDITLSGTHKMFAIHLDNIIPATTDTDLFMRFSVDAGSTFLSGASDYAWGIRGHANTLAYADTNSGDTKINLTRDQSDRMGNGTAEALNGWVYIHNANQTTLAVVATSDIVQLDSGANLNGLYTRGALIANIDEVDAVRFLASSGNLSSGRISLYGVNDS